MEGLCINEVMTKEHILKTLESIHPEDQYGTIYELIKRLREDLGKVKGSDLIFINRIDNDGQSLKPIEEVTKLMKEAEYKLNSLSITHKTYIATNMSSYVVKKKY